MKVGEHYFTHELMEASLKELRSVEYGYINSPFREIIVVPVTNKHSSGWGCMKFLLFNKGHLIGCLGGGCDMIYLNNIAGLGKSNGKLFKGLRVPRIGWKIDCLPQSRCLRIWCEREMVIENPHLVCNNFCPVLEENDLK